MTYGTPCHAIGHFGFWFHHVTYRTPCYASGHLVIYRECYGFERALLTVRWFLRYTLSCWFPGFPGAGSLTLNLAGLHADFWNIAPSQLFVWITTILKRGIMVGSVYGPNASFEVRVPQPWNLLITGFEPEFLKVLYVNSHLFWRLCHRAL